MASTPSSAGRSGHRPQSLVLSDGWPGFQQLGDLVQCHERHITGHGPKAAKHPEFHWVNTLLSNLKTSLAGTFHAFEFRSTVTATSPSSPGDSIGVPTSSSAASPAACRCLTSLKNRTLSQAGLDFSRFRPPGPYHGGNRADIWCDGDGRNQKKPTEIAG